MLWIIGFGTGHLLIIRLEQQTLMGAGSFHVYRSLFTGSTDSDLKTANTGGFAFRFNTSSGSNQFYSSNQENSNGWPMMFQGNKILDTTQSVAIQIGTVGQVTFLDNIIRSRSGVTTPAIKWFNNTGPDIIGIGKTYTVSSAINTGSATSPKYWNQDDSVVSYASINGSLPTMPSTYPNNGRTIVEIAPGSGSSTIQAAVNSAVVGTRTVIHFAVGSYSLGATITTPVNSDVQFVGDGYGSDLSWTGSSGGKMFSLPMSSKATFRELRFDSTNAESMYVTSADSAGSKIHTEGVFMEHINGNCVLTENLINTVVDLTGSEMNHQTNAPCLAATGVGGSGTSTLARFGGTIGADAVIDGPHYQVTNGGRILEEDVWFEGPNGRLIYPIDSGTFTFNVGHLAPQSGAPIEDFTQVTSFNGNITFLGAEYDFSNDANNTRQALHVVSQVGGTNILWAGQSCCQYNQNVSGGGPSYTGVSGSAGVVTLINNKILGLDGAFEIADSGVARTASFIRSMVAPIRTVLPTVDPAPNTASGVTDVRIYRVDLAASNVGIHIVSNGASGSTVNGVVAIIGNAKVQ